MSSSTLADDEFPNQLSSVDNRRVQEIRERHNLWRSNYHEASIYIEEGLNNDKFENHPRKRATLVAALKKGRVSNQTTPLVSCSYERQNPFIQGEDQQVVKNASSYSFGVQYTTIETYILVHNRYFYQLDLVASIILLLMAIVEQPAVEGYELNTTVHAAIEMFALGIIAIELLLKFRWMGPKRFFRHGRTVLKLAVLLTMNVEAIVIFLRHSMHARYSRALRPIFLIDNHYCHGIRRAIRQIFQSLPPILDMFTLALFFMFVFSIFGFYLFATNNTYFSDMPVTVGNLLILATTANLPDVMMPSYSVSRWSTVFFVLFVIIHLFLLTNLTMAAVYESFTRREKEKFHKLLLHRRKACQEAFKLLVSRREPNRIEYRQFMGLMRYLNRKCSMFDAYLIFKALDTDKNGSISIEEFYQIYDFINLEWKLKYPVTRWHDDYTCMPRCITSALNMIMKVVSHKYFEWGVDLLIAAAALLQFAEATAFQFDTLAPVVPTASSTIGSSTIRPDSISTTAFICIFTLEAVLRCLAHGWTEYWADRWNRFDLLVLFISIGGLVAGYVDSTPFGWVIVLRVLRLMRFFEFKRRYKDMWQTLTYILMKRFVSMTCVVMILYYFFAIVGMELLSQYDLRNCCKNTSLESQFKYDNSTETAKYYLNDFGDIVSSYLTLFSMSSNTYWLATMSAYSMVSQTDTVRIYFGFYYLCSIIVMNIVIAFILESFLFRIHYRSKMGNDCDDTNLFTVRVTLSNSEVDFLRKNLSNQYKCDKNFDKIYRAVARERHWSSSKYQYDSDNQQVENDEKISLLGNNKASANKRYQSVKLDAPEGDKKSARKKKQQTATSSDNDSQPPERRWYLIYQAEQIRNKFSFTMKMYADEVEEWLAEAERADQDAMSIMISRNQIRAEHVAMARLVRRYAAEHNDSLQHCVRGRSWSSSGGLIGNHTRRPRDSQMINNNNNNESKGA